MFTIGLLFVFSLSGWSRRIHTEFLVFRATQVPRPLHILSPTGLSPALAPISIGFRSSIFLAAFSWSYYPIVAETTMVWALPRSLAATGGIIVYFLFLRLLRCFSSPRWPSSLRRNPYLQARGLSHSDIPGSKVACTLPGLFAACHVLLRRQEPRHPPYALSFFIRLAFSSNPDLFQSFFSLGLLS